MDLTKLLEVVTVVLFTSAGQLMMRFGMKGSESVRNGVGVLVMHLVQTPSLWIAIALYGVSTLLWLRVLARYPVSAVYPMVAIAYVIVTLGGVLLFSEKVSLQGWIALAVICAGTVLLATSTSATVTVSQ